MSLPGSRNILKTKRCSEIPVAAHEYFKIKYNWRIENRRLYCFALRLTDRVINIRRPSCFDDTCVHNTLGTACGQTVIAFFHSDRSYSTIHRGRAPDVMNKRPTCFK